MTADLARLRDPVSDQDARFAIEGAIEWGRQGIKPPPDDHWLAPFWHMGKQLAALPALLTELEQLRAERDRYREDAEKAYKLWRLLDDIDTLDDSAKGNDSAFRTKCYEIQRRRFEIMTGEEWERIDAKLRAAK